MVKGYDNNRLDEDLLETIRPIKSTACLPFLLEIDRPWTPDSGERDYEQGQEENKSIFWNRRTQPIDKR